MSSQSINHPNIGNAKQNSRLADTLLKSSVGFWFTVILIGQWIFVAYLLLAYINPALQGNMLSWNQHMPKGFVEGDTIGNSATAIHIIFAVIIMGFGPLQLLPQIRKRFPTLHRYNGRVYMTTAFISSFVGFYMVWTRGSIGGPPQYIGISLDAVLIIVFTIISLRFAVQRNIQAHRRWALRLFMVVSAVWFYRVGLMFWLAANGGPVGIDLETFEGPFVTFIAFAQYMLPLAILELYFFSQDHAKSWSKYVTAAALTVCSAAMAFGIFAAYKGLWFPTSADAFLS